MKKNVAGQKVLVFAFTIADGKKTGDAANITCKVSKDNGERIDLTDNVAVETEGGFYLFSLTQEETNADTLDFYPVSSTANVEVIVPNHDRQTVDESTTSTTTTNSDVGPKRVKTKEVEIEAHDPLKLQLLTERQGSKAVKFGQFTGTYVKPKYGSCLCNDPREDEC